MTRLPILIATLVALPATAFAQTPPPPHVMFARPMSPSVNAQHQRMMATPGAPTMACQPYVAGAQQEMLLLDNQVAKLTAELAEKKQ